LLIQYSIFDTFAPLKRPILFITLFFFTVSTLVMPYANFDDVASLQAVYNHCLKEDADMDFFEFIGEKMLAVGFDPNEADEPHSKHPLQPIHGNELVQIQNGVIYQQTPQEIEWEQPSPQVVMMTVMNTNTLANGFYSGVFHPPAIAISLS